MEIFTSVFDYFKINYIFIFYDINCIYFFIYFLLKREEGK